MPKNKRRPTGALAAVALISAAWLLTIAPAAASPQAKRLHALSLVGEPRHGPDFKHFDWVNPSAPKGGRIRQRAMGTFDTLNAFAAKGSPASGLSLIYDTLMARSRDEPSTVYGLVAEWVSRPADYSSVTFGLRAGARFHDGAPITPEDVVFTLGAMKAASPQYALYYKNVVKAEKTGEREVTFTFDAPGNRELPDIVAGLPVLPRHFWQAKDEKGEPRDLARGTLDVPLGSGPYKIREVNAGRTIAYERVADWWAKDLPVSLGQWNFDEITFIYYRDRLPAFEAFKTGETDFWPENSAKGWATAYDVDAVKRGHIKRELLESADIAPMQGFAFNTRRKQFQDPRVRQAFNLAFNFEWANEQMFFGQYKRVTSYFENSELAAKGLPGAAELAILESVRKDVPPDVFTQEYRNPVNATPEDFRKHMRKASTLLAEAGWTPKGGVLTNAAGDKLSAEFLLVQPDFERLVLAYKAELDKLGMKIDIRTIDSAQYVRRIDKFDFDIVIGSFRQSLSPGNEQREFWGSVAADKEGTRNIIGIKNAGIDTLIERLIYATGSRRPGRRHPRPSIACCSGTTFSCHSSIRPTSGSRSGISSHGQRNCRAIRVPRAPSFRSGGGMTPPPRNLPKRAVNSARR